MFSVLMAVGRYQWCMSVRSIEQLAPVLLIPISILVGAAVFDFAGRPDLQHYSLVGVSIMVIAQTGFMAASEVAVSDRSSGALEALLTTPTAYALILAIRVLVITGIGTLGSALSYLLLILVFGDVVQLYHPLVAVVAIAGIVFGTACIALLLAGILLRSRSVRAVQSAMAGPLFLLAGVLVPIGLLHPLLQWPSKVLYLSWGADLLRVSFQREPVSNFALRASLLLVTGGMWGAIGWRFLSDVLVRMKRDGT